jgi:hypothetical protein
MLSLGAPVYTDHPVGRLLLNVLRMVADFEADLISMRTREGLKVARMRSLPATVVSTTLEGRLDWPNGTIVSGDGVDVVARLKESDVRCARTAARR